MHIVLGPRLGKPPLWDNWFLWNRAGLRSARQHMQVKPRPLPGRGIVCHAGLPTTGQSKSMAKPSKSGAGKDILPRRGRNGECRVMVTLSAIW